MRRCEDPELMDAEDASEKDLAESYRQLESTNRWLGNTAAVLRLLSRPPMTFKRVLDIGCGQGGLLLEIRKRFNVDVIGFDLRPAPRQSSVPILSGNAATDALPEADVAICVMMAHHLSGVELAGLIQNVSRSCPRLILLDLVRHPAPLWLFRIFVAPFLGRINALDGQTSIRRAYTEEEMREIVAKALRTGDRPVKNLRHTVAPFWIRQVVDISWEP
jgi:2-polyprenyl-3-methyl-5-hydroxy-6-metoxy-1,4-benzoquinol methylase